MAQVAWRTTLDDRYGSAAATLAKLHRRLDAEWRRGRISSEAFRAGNARWQDLASLAVDGGRPPHEIEAESGRIMTEILALPKPAPRLLPPLPKDRISPAEVVSLYRRLLVGEAEARMLAPPVRWSDLWQAEGEIRIEGWTLRLAVRESGISYTAAATAPDGRHSDYEAFEAREGDPYALLEDDEQQRLDAFVDRLEADPDETRDVLRSSTAGTPLEELHRLARISAWLVLKGAPETGSDGRRTSLEERLRAVEGGSRDGLSAADEEYLWDLEDHLARAARSTTGPAR
jgi:hypothetical protein